MLFRCSFSLLLFLTIVVQGYAHLEPWNSGLHEKYDGYGKEWIFIPDGKGQPQVAMLKAFDTEFRGMFGDSPISYILYTRDGPENGTRLHMNDKTTLKNSNFSASRQTKFITHGWKSSAFSTGLVDMKTAFLAHADYNVILVDWEPLAASTFYFGPMQNTRKVGQNAANFIDFLVAESGLKTQDIHFIGHSLGAHVAGNTGFSMKMGRLGRITGLDPALPGFHLLSTDEGRLDPTDATFVDIIHSCGGVLGFFQPLGQVDFYPNGGIAVQPGCCCVPELMEACSHGRSYMYFTESINSKVGFLAVKCDTWDDYKNDKCINATTTFMGEHVDRSANGLYFLKTRSESPFAIVTEISENEV